MWWPKTPGKSAALAVWLVIAFVSGLAVARPMSLVNGFASAGIWYAIIAFFAWIARPSKPTDPKTPPEA
ncbi:MAG: hypothetical protein V3T86_07395 [Planctomycetota bacterium]